MKTKKAEKYFEKRLIYLNNLVKEKKDNRNQCEIEKKELFKQIESYKKKIDIAYEVFSPKSAKNEFVREQINEFENRLKRTNERNEKIESEILTCENELKNIQDIITELQENETKENEAECQKTEIDCINIAKSEENAKIEKSDLEMVSLKRAEIRDIIYKCENCSAFINVDINRSRIELESVIDILKKIVGGQ